MRTLFCKCLSFLLSKTRKDMVAIKFKSPVQGAANLKGVGCGESGVMEFVSCAGGGEGMT